MVLPDSHRIPRAPWYLGARSREGCQLSPTGLAPSVVGLSRTIRLAATFVTLRPFRYSGQIGSHNTRRTTRTGLHTAGFRLFPVRSPLLGESRLLSLPRGTEMFQFPRFALPGLCIQPGVTGHDPRRVSPFGHLRVTGCLHLTGAYRSLPRPSSPSDAKASTIRP